MSFTKLTRSSVFVFAAIWVFISVPSLSPAEENEEMTTGLVPEALVLEPPQITTPGLVRWIGDPLQYHVGMVREMHWVQDGSRFYLGGYDGGNRRELWKVCAGETQLKLEAYLPLDTGFDASADGKWLIGARQNFRGPSNVKETLRLYHADSLQGVWEIPLNKFGPLDEVSFTGNGKYIIVVHQLQYGRVLSILDTLTGRRLKTITRTWPRPEPGMFDSGPGSTSVCVGEDEVVLPPAYDDQHRITRLLLPSMQIVPLTEPLSEEWRRAGVCHTVDGHWMSLTNNLAYAVWEWTGERYEERFRGEVPAFVEGSNIFSDYIACLCFSPDSSLLLISSSSKHKVIRLADQKILHESTTESMTGRFSPDGRTFWDFKQGFRAWDVATWQERPNPAPGPRYYPGIMYFSPSGFRLLMGNQCGVEVWEINGDHPLARLVTPDEGPISSARWSASGNEVYGADKNQYLRWKLPGAKTLGAMQQIKGEMLFEMSPGFNTLQPEERRKYIPYIGAVDADTDNCLLLVHRSPASSQLRNPRQPALIHHFNVPKGYPLPTNEDGFFGAGGKEFYYAAEPRPGEFPAIHHDDRTIFAYNVETGNLRQAKAPTPFGQLLGYDSKRRQLVSLNSELGIDILDAGTLTSLKDYLPQANMQWSNPGALSPDGRWLFCLLKENYWTSKLALLDLEQGKLAALIPEGDIPVERAQFSADSTFLAMGHRNGCVSIWRVAEMAAALPQPTMALTHRLSSTPKPLPPSVGVKLAKAGLRGSGPLPAIPLVVDGTVWKFDELGCLTSAPEIKIGQLRINDQPLTAVAQRFSFERASPLSPADQFTAMHDAENKVLVQRNIHVTVQGNCVLTDEVQNLSTTAQSFKISFFIKLGGDLAALRCEDGKAPIVNGTLLALSGNKTAIGAQLPAEGERLAQALCVLLSTPSAPQPPMLRWDAEQKAVISEWTVTVPPFQSRFVVHQLAQQPVNTPESLSNMFSTFRHTGLAAGLRGGRADKLLNGAVETCDRPMWQMNNMVANIGGDGRQKDSLGFQWHYLDIFDGVESEIGTSQLFPLWVNGFPAHFTAHTNLEPEADPHRFSGVSAGSALGTALSIHRRLLLSADEGCLITHDTLINGDQEVITTTVDLPLVSQTKIEAVIAANGRKLDLSQPVQGADCGEWISVVCSGADKPGFIVAVGSKDATLLPSIIRRGDNAVFLHYEVTVKPGEKISMAHLVAPRPLAAFDSPAAAITGLKTPMEFARFQLPTVPPAVNWPSRKP
jgi:WD40 repeat protein